MSLRLRGAEIEGYDEASQLWLPLGSIMERLKWTKQAVEFYGQVFGMGTSGQQYNPEAIAAFRGVPADTKARLRAEAELEAEENIMDFIESIWEDEFSEDYEGASWVGFWELEQAELISRRPDFRELPMFTVMKEYPPHMAAGTCVAWSGIEYGGAYSR